MSYLEQLNEPEDLRGMDPAQLPELCEELRAMITDVTIQNGGHLASSLGAVELVVSLLRVFDFERDRIVFDVGHQAYAYKILTGRRDRFHTLRTWDGISGYPKKSESPYDHFNVGHSSTSLSAALGYAKARDIRKQSHHVVAFVGDGSLLNGVALEALNNIQQSHTRLLIILNDNEMSINQRIGGFSEHIGHLSVNPAYRKLKETIKEQCRYLPRGERIETLLGRVKSHVKTFLQPANIFEELGITYWGPFDGHNVEEMEAVLTLAREVDTPILVHVRTTKGKGYPEAEKNPSKFHGVPPREPSPTERKQRSWSAAAVQAVTDLAARSPKVVCCTAAMKEGTKLSQFAEAYPERFFDVGIAEEHMLTFSAGLASGGLRPYAFIYSTFLQRGMDQLFHDLAMQDNAVVVAIDRAGLVGEDGETHHGLFDIAWCRAIPHITMAAPRDEIDLEYLFTQGLDCRQPLFVRYPRGKAPVSLARKEDGEPAGWGRAEVLAEGSRWLLIGAGSTIPILLDARDRAEQAGFPAPTVVDLRFLKPLDWETLLPVIERHECVVTAEEGVLAGGVGEEIRAGVQREGGSTAVHTLGVPDRLIPQGTRQRQLEEVGLTAEKILHVYQQYQTSS
ncbi:MAG: 1-deoxy-D-xylulose-5-phosphate synthase [Synergistales bacterium]|nr:1-deoxy-D-xylulose-5-phosphate synthase [Synergistales bacterium]